MEKDSEEELYPTCDPVPECYLTDLLFLRHENIKDI